MDYNARFYSPYLNRWIQPDNIVPDIKNPQSLNRYSYVENNPIIYIDTLGHAKILIIWGVQDSSHAFQAAAETQKRKLLEQGYTEDDILMVNASTEDDVFTAIAESSIGEIEDVYIYSHGWDFEYVGFQQGGLFFNDSNNMSFDNKLGG